MMRVLPAAMVAGRVSRLASFERGRMAIFQNRKIPVQILFSILSRRGLDRRRMIRICCTIHDGSIRTHRKRRRSNVLSVCQVCPTMMMSRIHTISTFIRVATTKRKRAIRTDIISDTSKRKLPRRKMKTGHPNIMSQTVACTPTTVLSSHQQTLMPSGIDFPKRRQKQPLRRRNYQSRNWYSNVKRISMQKWPPCDTSRLFKPDCRTMNRKYFPRPNQILVSRIS
mmetsp:Transcript_13923/g.30352  ORF Transcript_13923/g.30352 Transcript_13923/m.30352 type:complete len:225 (+) Transcript_13923:665-1339(+)